MVCSKCGDWMECIKAECCEDDVGGLVEETWCCPNCGHMEVNQECVK